LPEPSSTILNEVLHKDENLMTDILNAIHDVVAYYSPTHKILWLNEAGKKQLGAKGEAYMGKLCHHLWFGEDKPCPSCPVVSRRLVPTERLLRLDDNKIWMVRHTPLFNSKNELTGFIEFRADMTKMSNLETQILDEREKYRMLAENVPFGLILTRESKPVYVNKTFLEWFGFESVDDFEKKDFLSLIHPKDKDLAGKLFKKIEEDDASDPMEGKLRFTDKSGSTHIIRFELRNSMINFQKYVQIVLTDITSDVLKEKKQKQIAADALYLNQKNSILSEIESVLIKTLEDKKLSKTSEDFRKIFDIIDSFKQLDKDWKMLIANFEEVHPGFFSRLQKTHPLLSSNDLKHCACIKMNFGTKEIARFFNIKDSSVQISRVRLKKKMRLNDDTDLRGYILNF
jgi:PAS domain S-box-containing protein